MPLTSTLQVEILFLWIKLCPILDFCQHMDSYPVCLQGTVFFEKGKLWLIWQGNTCCFHCSMGSVNSTVPWTQSPYLDGVPYSFLYDKHREETTCVNLQNRWELKFLLRAIRALWHDFNEIVFIYFYNTRDWTQDLSNAVQAFYHWIILQLFFFPFN